MLWSCSKSLAWNDVPSSTGVLHDDSLCVISVNVIRQATIKLLERKELIKLNKVYEEKINLQDDLVKEQSIIIDTLQNRIVDDTQLYNELNDELYNQKEKYKKTVTYGGAVILTSILLILFR